MLFTPNGPFYNGLVLFTVVLPRNQVVHNRSYIYSLHGMFYFPRVVVWPVHSTHSGAVRGMHWPNNYAETDFHRAIGPPGSEMELIHTSPGIDTIIEEISSCIGSKRNWLLRWLSWPWLLRWLGWPWLLRWLRWS